MLFTFNVYRSLPIATASAIGFTGPLFTTLFAHFFLKEVLTYKKWILILVGYLGVLTLTQSFSLTASPYIWMALLANIFASGAIILAKKLSESEPPTTLVFYSTLGGFVFAMALALWVEEWPPFRDLLLLVGTAICGVLSNTFYMNALKYGKASFVAPFEYVRLIFAVTLGYLFFREVPDKYMVLGSVTIMCANFFLTRMELLKQEDKS